MTDNIEWGRFSGEFKTAPKGSSKAQNAAQNAPLRFQEDDDLLNLPNPIERFWIPIAVAIVAGWGAVGFQTTSTGRPTRTAVVLVEQIATNRRPH